MRTEIQQLPAEKLWLTGWGTDAEQTFQCGWETLRSETQDGLWKYNLVKEYLQKNSHITKIVWFDDEMDLWSERIAEITSADFLIIHTDARKGLTPEDLKNAKKFLNRNIIGDNEN